MQKGTLVRVRPVLNGERLRVVADVAIEGGGVVEATMPDREVAAILPRSVLVGVPRPGRRGARAPTSLLGTIAPILARMAEGRLVRLWDYNGRSFFSFLPWKSVRFVAEAADAPRPGSPAAGP